VTFHADACVGDPRSLTDADLTAFPWLRVEVRDGAAG